MLRWSHYRFQQRLVNKTREYRESQVIVCDEAYTSKTGGQCGKLHKKPGGNKTFHCPSLWDHDEIEMCMEREISYSVI